MKRILILCNNNSSRSQIAEELLRRFTFNRVEVMSAGINPQPVHPMAVKVMNELGFDISKNKSKSVNQFYNQKFDFVITVCEEAHEKCPEFQGSYTKIHKNTDDPAKQTGSKNEQLEVFRKVRDELKEWLTDFIERYKLS